MREYPDEPTQDVRERRERLFKLFENRRDDEAADYALTLDESVTIFSPIEAIADRIRKRRPDDARRLYLAALEGARTYASWATGGGEGLSRMVAVHDLEEKLSLAPRRPRDTSSKDRAKARTPKNADGDNVAHLHFDSVEKALTFVTSCLENDKLDELFRACATPSDKVVFACDVGRLRAISEKVPLLRLYGNPTFPTKRSTLKIGGHSAQLGHIHIDFIKTDNGWSLQNVASCCAKTDASSR
jgi:hypothetical protein